MCSKRKVYRVRSDGDEWRVDRRWLLIWLPVGRWMGYDWWAPYTFATAGEADYFRAKLM